MAARKHKTRTLAMQVLYLWGAEGNADRAIAMQSLAGSGEEPSMQEEAAALAASAWEFHVAADEWVTRLAPQWPASRQPAVDRAILRLAVWELTHSTTPPKVVIDEAIELAKEFSTENSSGFVNGVLDAVLREHRALKGETGPLEGGPAGPEGLEAAQGGPEEGTKKGAH